MAARIAPARRAARPVTCDCPACAPASDHLTAPARGWLALAGAAAGSAVAFLIDPAGAAWALTDAVRQLLGLAPL